MRADTSTRWQLSNQCVCSRYISSMDWGWAWECWVQGEMTECRGKWRSTGGNDEVQGEMTERRENVHRETKEGGQLDDSEWPRCVDSIYTLGTMCLCRPTSTNNLLTIFVSVRLPINVPAKLQQLQHPARILFILDRSGPCPAQRMITTIVVFHALLDLLLPSLEFTCLCCHLWGLSEPCLLMAAAPPAPLASPTLFWNPWSWSTYLLDMVCGKNHYGRVDCGAKSQKSPPNWWH
jgi:hypothetical protein